MFISPALEELTEERHMSGQTGTSGAAPSDLTNLQQELASQLASVDQAKFHQVKQAIKSAVQDQRDSADIHTVVQHVRQSVQQVLNGTGSATDETRGYLSTVADAVMSAGTAVGQLSSQILGGGELQTELAEDEGSLRAEEAIEPVKQWWQRQQSSAPTDYFTSEDRDTPHGHVSHTEQAHQSSRPGNTTVTSSQQTSESASCGDQLQQPSRQGGDPNNFSRSSHRQSETNTLEGDAQNVGLEEARRRARGIY